jgi:hypothetical protein
MNILKIKFQDNRTDKIFGYSFINGESQEPLPEFFIEKLIQLGDGSKFTTYRENFITKEKYDKLLMKFKKRQELTPEDELENASV